MRAVRKHLGDFLAIAALALVGLAVTGYVLVQQGAVMPAWVPVIGSDGFRVEARFSSAQAVTPGQGQTVNVAGVRVGDVVRVELEGGEAVVTMEIEERYASLVDSRSTLLLRPRTGLQDMTVEVDTTGDGEPLSEGSTIPLSQTQPNVNPDEILASLDGDTQAYLRLLLQAGARGVGGRGEELSAGLRRFEPLARDLRRIGRGLAERRAAIRSAITSLRRVSEELGDRDTRLAEFVSSSNEVMAGFASQEAALREALRELPPALRATRGALDSSGRFARAAAPALEDLTPVATALGPALREVRPFLRRTVEPIRDQIRPFTRATTPATRHLRQAAGPLAASTDNLGEAFTDLNRLFNALAYNPPGPADEGYLFWLAWLNHNTNALFYNQDAHGPMRRGAVVVGCFTAGLADGVTSAAPFLRTIQQLSNVPSSSDPRVCPP